MSRSAPSGRAREHFVGPYITFSIGGVHMRTRKLCLVLAVTFFLAIALAVSQGQAASVELAWDAPSTNADGTPLTDLAGYKLYYGQTSGNYDGVVDVSNVTSFILSDLTEGQTYFFVATAYDFSGNESDFSNEVSTTIPISGSTGDDPVASFSMSAASGPAPLTVALTDTSSGHITAWNWDFGDGTTSTEQNPSHTYTASGSYTVSLTVSGSPADTATQTITVTEPGVPGEVTMYVAYDSRATRYPDWLTASYTNTGQTIRTSDVPLTLWQRNVAVGTISLPGNQYGAPQGVGSNYIVLIDLHGAGYISALNPSSYQVGNLQVGSTYYIDRDYTITSMPGGFQEFLSIKTANNDKNNTLAELITFTINVAPNPEPPLAVDDTATTPEDTPVTTENVLANDTDANGDTLSIAGFTQPANGTVTKNNNNTFTYTPAANFNGADTFTYTVRDPGGLTDTATVTVTVTPVNDAPAAAADRATTNEGMPVTISVLANDSDVDGDALTVAATTQGSHGAVAINADNTVTYTPTGTFTGTDTFTYTVRDDKGATATGTVTVSVGTAEFVMVWLEAEEGLMQFPMEVGVDDEASAGQYAWVPEGNGTLRDPSQAGGVAQYTFTVPEPDAYVIWGRVRPNVAGNGSFYIAVHGEVQDPGQGGEGSVTEVSPQQYEVAQVYSGDTYYIDRDYTITAMPAEFEGLLAIKTANNDKNNADAEFLTFSVTQDAALYVAYDSRATRYPDWLTASFTETGQTIRTTDVPLTVWRQDVAAGTVTLPGNTHGAPQGVGSNYFVLVAFPGQEILPIWAWSEAALDTTPIFFLEAGVHTLVLKQLESGTQIDRILVTNDLEYIPQGIGD
jgi:PKD repeat protein